MGFNKKGFTLVEILLVFFFLFLVMAAITPIVTRKHLQPPTRKIHGLYACYRDENNKLRQTYIKNSKVIQNEKLVDKCSFEKPKKALYYYVQIIGGGGGGASVAANPLVDNELLINPNTTGTEGYVACGQGTKSTSSTSCINYSSISKTDFNKLTSIKLDITAKGDEGYTCSTDTYAVCQAGVEASGTFICAKYDLDASVAGANCTLNSSDKYDCTMSYTEPACEEGWSKVELEQKVTCTNNDIGAARTFYYQIPLTYGLNITGTKVYPRSDKITYNGKRYSLARSGYGISYSWNGSSANSITANGGDGAILPLVREDVFDGDTSKRCLEPADYRNMHIPSDAYCSMTTGSCLTSIPSSSIPAVSFDSVKISQYNYSQTQKLSYGIGGSAGEVKTMILRDIDSNVVINPGRGGAVGESGVATVFGSHTVSGGKGETSTAYSSIDILPLNPSPSADTISAEGRTGETAKFESFIKFVLSYKLKPIKEKLETIGRGGDGDALKTNCTYGYNYTPLIMYVDSNVYDTVYVGTYNVMPVDLSDYKCNGVNSWVSVSGYNQGYWENSISKVSNATAGGSGAVIITW